MSEQAAGDGRYHDYLHFPGRREMPVIDPMEQIRRSTEYARKRYGKNPDKSPDEAP